TITESRALWFLFPTKGEALPLRTNRQSSLTSDDNVGVGEGYSGETVMTPSPLTDSRKDYVMYYAKITRIAVVTAFLSGIVLLGSTQAGQHGAQAKTDIVDTAVAAGSFTTLTSALKAADLVGTLKGAGPFTVFAP